MTDLRPYQQAAIAEMRKPRTIHCDPACSASVKGAPILSTHDSYQICLMHPRSGYFALAQRVDVASARADEMRTAFTTSFCRTWDTRRMTKGPFPRGEAVLAPTPEEARWAAAVSTTLDAYSVLPDLERYFADLQAIWRNGR